MTALGIKYGLATGNQGGFELDRIEHLCLRRMLNCAFEIILEIIFEFGCMNKQKEAHLPLQDTILMPSQV
jgi:hypothetical protein